MHLVSPLQRTLPTPSEDSAKTEQLISAIASKSLEGVRHLLEKDLFCYFPSRDWITKTAFMDGTSRIIQLLDENSLLLSPHLYCAQPMKEIAPDNSSTSKCLLCNINPLSIEFFKKSKLSEEFFFQQIVVNNLELNVFKTEDLDVLWKLQPPFGPAQPPSQEILKHLNVALNHLLYFYQISIEIAAPSQELRDMILFILSKMADCQAPEVTFKNVFSDHASSAKIMALADKPLFNAALRAGAPLPQMKELPIEPVLKQILPNFLTLHVFSKDDLETLWNVQPPFGPDHPPSEETLAYLYVILHRLHERHKAATAPEDKALVRDMVLFLLSKMSQHTKPKESFSQVLEGNLLENLRTLDDSVETQLSCWQSLPD